MTDKALIERLKVVLRRTLKGEVLSVCDRCNGSDSEPCVPCNGTGWKTAIPEPEPRKTPITEVGVTPEVYGALRRALRDLNLGPLADYGFYDMKIQPYDGMYSNPYPLGEPFEIRIIKSNYRQQQIDDARALAANEAWYLEPPL